MSNILIIGNVIKDVYLRLDEHQNHFEQDENGTSWLDLAFNGETHHFMRRISIFGGSAITLEVLSKFGLTSHIAGVRAHLIDGGIEVDHDSPHDYRYILCRDNEVAYLTSTKRAHTIWEMPAGHVDWIFVDRSAIISPQLTQQLLKFLSLSQQTRLAIYTDPYTSDEATLTLLKHADLIFTEQKLPAHFTGFYCHIAKDYISLSGEKIAWHPEKADLFTHLTTNSTIAATVFSALLKGKTNAEALQFAKINVENATLRGTLDYQTIEDNLREEQNHTVSITDIARALVAPGKGILAADESGGSIHKKFEAAGIPDDEAHRRDYRNIFFTTPDLEKYVSGVILFDETARQHADDGRSFIDFLTAKGIIPGVKVDKGLVKFHNSEETWTDGLTDLDDRLKEYYNMGLRFAKWRAAFEVRFDENGKMITPTPHAIQKNCEILAKYALACQNASIVPIVEPEVVHDGDYSVETCAKLTTAILHQLFEELSLAKVQLEGCLLKCNMVLAGKQYHHPSTPEEVGRWTAHVLRTAVPPELAGVVFLSGGQTVTQATENLQAVTNCGPYPWPVTFSYARALQGPALDAWQGDNANADAARTAFRQRLIANANALKKSV